MELGILRVLLVRHGLSEDNQNAIWAGHRDAPLTGIGVQQAKALGIALSNFSFVAIYTSDLKRASSTAEEILTANRSIPPPPLVQTQSLREQHFGQAEGKSWSDGEYAHAAAAQAQNARSFRFPDGESLDDVNARMAVSLRRYVLPRLEALRSGQERSEPQIIIVAHGIAIAEILRVLMSMHDSGAGNGPWPDPAATYKRVRLENTGWTLVELAVPIGEGDSASTQAASATSSFLANSSSSTLDDGVRKPTYMRIVQQNITDHLRGPLAINATNVQQTSGKGVGGQVGNLLAGGGGGASSTTSTSEPGDSPSLATLSLRTVNTYDARQLMRELERAGATSSFLKANGKDGVAGTQTGATSSGAIGQFSSSPFPSVSVTSSPSAAIANAPGAWSDVWQGICVQVLPLFNKEDLRTKIETINSSVSEHIRRSLERSPARALDSLSRDLYAVCAAGMFTLNSKLDAVSNDEVRLLEGFVDVWKTFHWRTLPWLEACFLPLQTDPTLVSLSRQGADKTTSNLRTELIDIWRIALTVFRDQLIIPRFERLINLYLRIHELDAIHVTMLANGSSRVRSSDDIDDPDGDSLESRQMYPRLSQMNSILHGVQTNDDNQAAMEGLERALRVGNQRKIGNNGSGGGGGASGMADLSMTSSSTRGAKRAQARQGWIPRSAAKNELSLYTNGVEGSESLLTDADGDESAFLSSLRSPTLDEDDSDERVSSSLALTAAPPLPLSAKFEKALESLGQENTNLSPQLRDQHMSGDAQTSASRPLDDPFRDSRNDVDDEHDGMEARTAHVAQARETIPSEGAEQHSVGSGQGEREQSIGLGKTLEQLSGSTLREGK